MRTDAPINGVAKAAGAVLVALPPWAVLYLPAWAGGLVAILCAGGLVWLVPNQKDPE